MGHTQRHVLIQVCDPATDPPAVVFGTWRYILQKLKYTQLWERIFCRNSSLQAVCDTPIAYIYEEWFSTWSWLVYVPGILSCYKVLQSGWGWLNIAGGIASWKGETQAFQSYGRVWATALFLLLLHASYSWYEVRRCVFYCCVGRVVMLSWFDLLLLWTRTRTYIVTGTKARAWSAAAVVPLLLYCWCAAVCCFCGCY